MKKLILIILATINLLGSIEISQNMKALYRNVKLTEEQKKYIFDSENRTRKILKNKLLEIMQEDENINEKNVVAFKINEKGEYKDIKLLQESGNEKIDRAVINAVKKAAIQFPRPKQETEMRYIISFESNKNIKSHFQISKSTH